MRPLLSLLVRAATTLVLVLILTFAITRLAYHYFGRFNSLMRGGGADRNAGSV